MFENPQEETIRASIAPDAPASNSKNPARQQNTSDERATVRAPAVPAPEQVYRNTIPAAPPPPPAFTRESAARERFRNYQSSPRRKGGGEWAWVIIAVAMLGAALMVSMSMFLLLRASRDVPEVLPTADFVFSALPTPVDFRGDGKGGPGSLVFSDGTKVELKPWDGTSRLTILLIGLDRRPGETGLGYRTDTMMLVSLDPRTNQVGLLSIPRDLYVDVPGFYGMHRVNEPMVLGELRETGYGPRLTMETLQYNLAIRVHNYVIVDFNAFIGLVDALGGIDIDLDYNIYDSSYPSMNYGYEAFSLTAGHHVLDGATALKFARTRHGDSDFKRAERQQQVLYAIRDKVTRPEALPQLLTQAPSMWDALSDNVYTGLTLDQLVQIALYLKDVPASNIHADVIDYGYAVPFTTSSGAQVLLPNRDKIAVLMAELFGADYSQ
jgi:LCP family protein required for cell wall assembly